MCWELKKISYIYRNTSLNLSLLSHDLSLFSSLVCVCVSVCVCVCVCVCRVQFSSLIILQRGWIETWASGLVIMEQMVNSSVFMSSSNISLFRICSNFYENFTHGQMIFSWKGDDKWGDIFNTMTNNTDMWPLCKAGCCYKGQHSWPPMVGGNSLHRWNKLPLQANSCCKSLRHRQVGSL